MAAGTSDLEVPELFDEFIDDDSSSSSEYCSIVSDSCGLVEDSLFSFSKDDVVSVLGDVDYRDEVSLMFLLTDDVSDTFHKLLQPYRCGEVLISWLKSQEDGCWESKLIESLCIIQNYQVLRRLVQNVVNEQIRFAPHSPDYSLFVNCTRKALYMMCEELCAKELNDMVFRVKETCPQVHRTFVCEFMEINLMYWACCQCISLGDINGQGVDVHLLKTVLKTMNRSDLVETLESSQRTLTVDRDGPHPPDTTMPNFSSKRLCINPTKSIRVTLQSLRLSNMYKVDPDNVGVCLIINQKMFHKESNPRFQHQLVMKDGMKLDHREGTDVDRDRLVEVFYSMGFTIIIAENLTHQKILSTLQQVIKNNVEREHSCFALCILSHGAQGIVSGTNSVAVYKEELDCCLKDPKLIGKAKLMILQVCQGDKLQDVVYYEDMAVDGPQRSIGELADTLTFWSTMPGFASIRDHSRGTWFVEALWQVFMSARTTEDITTLFTRVTNIVTNRSQHLEGSYKTMVPEQCNRLTKTLVLPHHPGRILDVALLLFGRFLFEALVKQYIERL